MNTREIKSFGNTELVEKDLFLEAIYRCYGFDFRKYACASMLRRIKMAMTNEGLSTISAFQDLVLRDPECMERFLKAVVVNVTSMFRDPAFFLVFREKVVPILRTYPFIRIWIAGCSTGEETYSLAILLEEEGIYERTRIYSTDISSIVLKTAQESIFPLSKMKEYTVNYQRSGGRRDFSEYYSARYERAIFKASLKRNMIFAQHNLATDSSFNEFNVILCRNVMIYFNQDLQDRVFRVFHDSLCPFGILALGNKESLRSSSMADQYEELDREERLFRRVK